MTPPVDGERPEQPGARAPAADASPLPRWSVGVLVGGTLWAAVAEATTRPWALNPDGISYLDQAAAWRAGELTQAINSYWSPGYPVMLALWEALTSPFGMPAIPGAHVLNVLIAGAFALAAACLHRELDAEWACDGVGRPRRWMAWGTMFLVVVLAVAHLAPPTLLTPDLLMATMLLVLATSAVREIRATSTAGWSWLRLGLLTGVLYLTKTAGLPVGVVLVACATFAATGATVRTVLSRGTRAALGCAVLVVPWATALSLADGRLTLGSSATLNRTWSWDEGGHREAIQARQGPQVLAYPRDAGGTLPLWYAPQKFVGESPAPVASRARPILAVVSKNLHGDARRWHFFLLGCAGLVVLARAAGGPPARSRLLLVLIVPPLAGLAMYLLVYAEGRFYAGYVVLATLAAAGAALATPGGPGPLLRGAAAALVLLAARPLLHAQKLPDLGPYPNPYRAVIEKLQRAGISPGSSVAVVGDPLRAYWALPAGVRVAATLELPSASLYHNAPEATRRRWEDTFRGAGAEVVVLTHGPFQATVLPLAGEGGP